MSTKFPTQSREPPLTLLLQNAERRVSAAVLTAVSDDFPGLQAPHLALFGALDCGATHAAAAAERLGISRQAVARTARDLADMGLLRLHTDTDRRNRNRLEMTARGEALALAGRRQLARIEAALGDDLTTLRRALAVLAAAPIEEDAPRA